MTGLHHRGTRVSPRGVEIQVLCAIPVQTITKLNQQIFIKERTSLAHGETPTKTSSVEFPTKKETIQKGIISNMEFQRARVRSVMNAPISPELVAAQQRAIAALKPGERKVFDSTLWRIGELSPHDSPAIIEALARDSIHWVFSPLVKLYLAQRLARKIDEINW